MTEDELREKLNAALSALRAIVIVLRREDLPETAKTVAEKIASIEERLS